MEGIETERITGRGGQIFRLQESVFQNSGIRPIEERGIKPRAAGLWLWFLVIFNRNRWRPIQRRLDMMKAACPLDMSLNTFRGAVRDLEECRLLEVHRPAAGRWIWKPVLARQSTKEVQAELFAGLDLVIDPDPPPEVQEPPNATSPPDIGDDVGDAPPLDPSETLGFEGSLRQEDNKTNTQHGPKARVDQPGDKPPTEEPSASSESAEVPKKLQRLAWAIARTIEKETGDHHHADRDDSRRTPRIRAEHVRGRIAKALQGGVLERELILAARQGIDRYYTEASDKQGTRQAIRKPAAYWFMIFDRLVSEVEDSLPADAPDRLGENLRRSRELAGLALEGDSEAGAELARILETDPRRK